MSRVVELDELREKPDRLIAAIEEGECVSITQGGRHVATLNPVPRSDGGVPYPGRDFDFGPQPENLDIDPAEVVIAERERARSLKKYGL